MIPRGRPTLTLPQVAAQFGVSLATFKRKHQKAFTAAVKPVDKAQPYQYDQAQVTAYLAALRAAEMDPDAAARAPLPALPSEPHPDDLLTDKEAGKVLGIEPSTVRAYAATGVLPAVDVHNASRWRRGDVEAHRDKPNRRHRVTGSRNKAPRADRDPRAAEVGDWLTAAAQGQRPPVTTAEIRDHYDVPDYTARRILARAQERHTSGQADQQHPTTSTNN
ncbi:helix-turn-helix domain-containing protein [Streptomyces sp. NPDC001118]